MARVVFTSNLQRHISCPPESVEASTVREALDGMFAHNAQLKGYILDDQGRLRQHVIIYVDGQPIGDRWQLSDSVGAESEIYVMQALSGG